jgi:hypothetical protein
MRKYVIGIIIFTIVLVSGCTTKEAGVTCEDLGGNFLEEHNECEYISQAECDILGGTYNECASACRHDPNAEMCIEVCVPVCYLEEN